MALDFSKINRGVVGLRLQREEDNPEEWGRKNYSLVNVTFREFSQHYCEGAETVRDIYGHLSTGLAQITKHLQESRDSKHRVDLEGVATLALKAENIRNAMYLIEENYL